LLVACVPLFAQQYTISTIAGGGGGFSGVLHNPTSVAIVLDGNVCVGDWSGYIHKIHAADGSITIVAGTDVPGYSGDGGQAELRLLGKAVNIALDHAGNIYIADDTVAGTGAATDSGDGALAIDAGVSRPSGIAVDAKGDLYFSSSWSRIRKIGAHTGLSKPLRVRWSMAPVETTAGHRRSFLGSHSIRSRPQRRSLHC